MTSERRYAFGQYHFDAATGDLHGPAGLMHLTPKARAVLGHLILQADRLVTKDELLDTLWPGVFVGDGVLKVCIHEIRSALGDDARLPSFIETSHRRGYRFVAPLCEVRLTAGPSRDPVIDGGRVHSSRRTSPERFQPVEQKLLRGSSARTIFPWCQIDK